MGGFQTESSQIQKTQERKVDLQHIQRSLFHDGQRKQRGLQQVHHVQNSVRIHLRPMNVKLVYERVALEEAKQVRVVGHLADLDAKTLAETFKEVAGQYLELAEQLRVVDPDFPRWILHQLRVVVEQLIDALIDSDTRRYMAKSDLDWFTEAAEQHLQILQTVSLLLSANALQASLRIVRVEHESLQIGHPIQQKIQQAVVHASNGE